MQRSTVFVTGASAQSYISKDGPQFRPTSVAFGTGTGGPKGYEPCFVGCSQSHPTDNRPPKRLGEYPIDDQMTSTYAPYAAATRPQGLTGDLFETSSQPPVSEAEGGSEAPMNASGPVDPHSTTDYLNSGRPSISNGRYIFEKRSEYENALALGRGRTEAFGPLYGQ